MKNLFTAALVACFALPAAAHDYKLGDIVVTHPMAFETPKSAQVGGGYLSITNTAETADRLLSVSADGFDDVTLHESTTDDMGVARMQPVEGIDLPAGETVMLKPGGLHVMFMGLNGDPFEIGEKIPATLTFEKAGTLDVTFNVESRRAAHGDEMDHSHHDMKD
ncbi:copper chaperone PCu(A)C [Sulfitobacter sp. S0837]|uniref:copper chaperone PCu(A)C n=1 Tax=Sulfitobacter maritimus TaxID=2741719 RepID=UPI0015825EC8|nr:copper chaperone PCu(A)C [Sulfitobacter maritimus]NUH66484.1 copper chaperone PCu(A)C [Sulfitobacter maritimus]